MRDKPLRDYTLGEIKEVCENTNCHHCDLLRKEGPVCSLFVMMFDPYKCDFIFPSR